jgi:hypothetical protein
MKTSLEKAVAKRDRALAKHERFVAKAAKAREEWIKWSADAAVLGAAASPAKLAVVAARAAHHAKPHFSAIARRAGVTPQHVRRVFLGLSTSARIMAEIQADLASRDSGVAA